MLLGKSFAVFIKESPISVMVSGTMERVFEPAMLDRIFQDHAVLGYAKELTFSQCVQIMSDVVFKESPSVGAYYQAHHDEIPVTRQAVYDKLKHLEPQVPAALVHYSAEELLPCIKAMGSQVPPLLPRYRVRVLDGNHLTGTEHRIFELRRFRAAVLPGQALVFYDPRYDLMTDVIPCEDAYAQERSLLDQALNCISARDCILADRNFCTTGFLFGIRRRKAFFVIRQHASTLSWELRGKRHLAGQDGRGRDIYEQAICLTNPETGEIFTARRITIALDKPNKDGETELHILTNLPRQTIGTVRVADLYSDRWTIETGFQHLTDDLRCEIDTLGYPKAALFGFCTACVAYNAVSVVKAAIRVAQGKKYVEEELSMYYLTLEVSQVTPGMMIAIPAENWGTFRRMSPKKFAATLVELAHRLDPRKYIKHKRGPKRPQPKKISGKTNHHVSTARILAMRK
ncbi:MAG: transposase [Thermoguttaceae bacterium]